MTCPSDRGSQSFMGFTEGASPVKIVWNGTGLGREMYRLLECVTTRQS